VSRNTQTREPRRWVNLKGKQVHQTPDGQRYVVVDKAGTRVYIGENGEKMVRRGRRSSA